MYMWAAHGARSPGPPAAWSLYLGCMYNEAPPPWPLAEPALASAASASRFRCSTELPYSPSRDGLSYLTKFLFFRLFRLFPLFSLFPPLPLRFDAKLHASNRTPPVAASGHAIEAAEPFAIPDFHHRLSRSQPQPHPPPSDKVFVLDCFFVLLSRSRAIATTSGLNRAWLSNSAFRVSRLLISGSRRQAGLKPPLNSFFFPPSPSPFSPPSNRVESIVAPRRTRHLRLESRSRQHHHQPCPCTRTAPWELCLPAMLA